MKRHYPQRVLDEARDEIRFNGGRVSDVAERLGVSADQLARMIGLPRLQAIPDDGEPCIFEAAERLNQIL